MIVFTCSIFSTTGKLYTCTACQFWLVSVPAAAMIVCWVDIVSWYPAQWNIWWETTGTNKVPAPQNNVFHFFSSAHQPTTVHLSKYSLDGLCCEGQTWWDFFLSVFPWVQQYLQSCNVNTGFVGSLYPRDKPVCHNVTSLIPREASSLATGAR